MCNYFTVCCTTVEKTENNIAQPVFLRKHVPKDHGGGDSLTHSRLQIEKECSTISLGIRNKFPQAMKSPVSFTSTSIDLRGKRTSTGNPQAHSHLATAQCFLQTHQLSAEWPRVQLQRILSFSCTKWFFLQTGHLYHTHGYDTTVNVS